MNLKTIIKDFSNDEIIKRLIELYPDQKKSVKGYIKVLEELRTLKPIKDKMQILIERVEEDGEKWVNISGFDKKEKLPYAIEYEIWDIWLGMKIHDLSLKEFNNLDIICYCLWEMTWSGFEQKQIQKTLKSLVDIKL